MSGVIVVDAESFRFTCLGRDAYIMIIPRYTHNYSLFYQLLDSNLFTHRTTYAILREATSESYGPRVYFPSYLISRQQAISGAVFILLSLLLVFIIKISKILSYHLYQISLLQVAVKGLTTPLSRWLQGSLCAGVVYVMLCGSPTGSITLVSSLREIPTIAVLHHPFLFGEIPTQLQATSAAGELGSCRLGSTPEQVPE